MKDHKEGISEQSSEGFILDNDDNDNEVGNQDLSHAAALADVKVVERKDRFNRNYDDLTTLTLTEVVFIMFVSQGLGSLLS